MQSHVLSQAMMASGRDANMGGMGVNVWYLSTGRMVMSVGTYATLRAVVMTGEEKLTYSAFGASCSEVEVNLLTGERRVLRADIMMDAGNSLSPAIDAGQVCLIPVFSSTSMQEGLIAHFYSIGCHS